MPSNRLPWEILNVEDHPQRSYYVNGTPVRDAQITVSERMFEAMREGWYCIRCFEPQEEAMPEHCSLCGYPMRKHQAELLEQDYEGDAIDYLKAMGLWMPPQ